MYFQPFDGPNREAMWYDTEYVEKYNEDLNTTLIFVRFRVLFPMSR